MLEIEEITDKKKKNLYNENQKPSTKTRRGLVEGWGGGRWGVPFRVRSYHKCKAPF